MKSANEKPFLKVRNVWKHYPDNETGWTWKPKMRAILKDVSFSIPKGSVVGLLGESGSGKSTLSRLILGLEQPDSGTVLVEDVPVTKWHASHQGKTGVVFQDYLTSINPTFTVGQAIAEGFLAGSGKPPDMDEIGRLLRNAGLTDDTVNRGPQRISREEILDLMTRTGLPPDLIDRLPGQLSGGQAQRVCIARAIAPKPDFIVFDEAVSGLDAPVQAEIVELLKKLQGNATYLFITHDIQIAALLCDKIVVLHHGKLTDILNVSHMGTASSPYLRKLVNSTVIFHSTYEPDSNGDSGANSGKSNS